MKVSELIEELKKLPADASVFYLYDGWPYGGADLVYESKAGHIVISAFDEYCNDERARPKDAPTKEQSYYFELPSDPNAERDEDGDLIWKEIDWSIK